MYEAKVITDSISPFGARITSMQLRYPLIIHAEMCRHRAFSRSVASNRAIPTHKQLAMIRENPYIPESWGTNQAGMQAGPPLESHMADDATQVWKDLVEKSCSVAEALGTHFNVHKQWANRVLLPFQWVTELITGTDEGYANFFTLRNHPAAQPEMQKTAKLMKIAYVSSDPEPLKIGEWHLPYIKGADVPFCQEQGRLGRRAAAVSAMRCARVSYLNHDRSDPDPRKDFEDFQTKLFNQVPKHSGPMEHQAMCMPFAQETRFRCLFDENERFAGLEAYAAPASWDNFTGWMSFRHILSNKGA